MQLTDQDWDILLPGTTVKVGRQNLEVKPLGLESLAGLMRELRKIITTCVDAGITLDNYESRIVDFAGIVLSEAPEVLTMLTDIDVADIKRLPVSVTIKILTACFQANIDSQEDLAKNLMTLVGQVAALAGAGETQAAESEA